MRRGGRGGRRERHGVAQRGDDLGECRSEAHLNARRERELRAVLARCDHATAARAAERQHLGERAAHPAQASVESQLAEQAETLERLGFEHSSGREDSDCDRQVEAGADFRNDAGARFTVTRRSGNGSPSDAIAARTRAALSRTAASGNPTTSTRGSCELIRTSTSTGTPSTPTRAPPITRDTAAPRDRGGETRNSRHEGRARRSEPCLPP